MQSPGGVFLSLVEPHYSTWGSMGCQDHLGTFRNAASQPTPDQSNQSLQFSRSPGGVFTHKTLRRAVLDGESLMGIQCLGIKVPTRCLLPGGSCEATEKRGEPVYRRCYRTRQTWHLRNRQDRREWSELYWPSRKLSKGLTTKNKSVFLLIYHSLNLHENTTQDVYKILDTWAAPFGSKQEYAALIWY